MRLVSRGRAHRAPRRRDGFTMPELLIAIIVIAVGLLSLASGSVGVLRQMRYGNQSTLASAVAQQRLEAIRSQGCASLSSGTATTRGLSEKWVITVMSNKARAVAESVKYVPRAGQTNTLAMSSVVPCA